MKDLLKHELDIKVELNRKLCVYAKAHRLTFGTKKKANSPGNLISCDIVGPFCNSFGKNRYFLDFKDSFTKFRYGYFLKEKSEAKTALENMLSHARQHNHAVKELLSGEEGKFDNAEVRNILSKHEVTRRLTAQYTPKQNGSSERDNRKVIEMAKTFKYSNKSIQILEALFAELVNIAIYVLNTVGKSSVKNKSPHKVRLGQELRIKHLRIIGLSFVHVPKKRRKKNGSKS